MDKVSVLISEIGICQQMLLESRIASVHAFYSVRLKQLKARLDKVGRRYNCVRVTYSGSDGHKMDTFFTDISLEAAMKLVSIYLGPIDGSNTITAMEVPLGRLIPREI